LPETSVLSDEFVRQLSAVGEADVLVGVPTFNNRETIERVVKAVQIGLTKYFHRDRCVLINPDGGSTDGTPEIFKEVSVKDFGMLLTSNPLRTFHRVSAPYHGIPGKETALRTLFAAADLLRAKACAIFSPDVLSVTPEWVESLIRPIYREHFDLVAPVYQRQKFDGLLVKSILSPVIRATYGAQVREPVGGELAISGRLACHFLEKDIWDQEMTSFGLEIWMVTTAIVDGFQLCETFLGPKLQAAKQFGQDLPGTIRQVVGALFRCLEMHEAYWIGRAQSEVLPIFGFQYDVALEPLRLDRKRMLDTFRSNIDQLVPILESILTPQTLVDVRKAVALPDREFRYPSELWAKTVYEFAAAFHRSVINRDHLLQALTPLYRGWVSSFVLQHSRGDARRIDQEIEELGREFERSKPYLLDRWTAEAGGKK
jgi:glucosylglycerate synthase